MKKCVSVAVLDLDNTLFDWFSIWFASFGAMLDVLVDQSGIDRQQLTSDFHLVHQHHQTSEYAFSISELPSLRSKHPDADPRDLYQDAIDAFRAAESANMRLNPGVAETLRCLKRAGVLLVAYTESLEFYACYRLIKLGLDEQIDYLYSPPDHALPANMTPDQIRHYPPSHYVLRHTQRRNTPRGERKPNPHLLKQIIEEVGGTIESTFYVGDSKMKDIAMANAAGVTSVWAKYGASPPTQQYTLLQQVTHWSPEDVAREEAIKNGTAGKDLIPSVTLRNTFDELLAHFEFSRHSA